MLCSLGKHHVASCRASQ